MIGRALRVFGPRGRPPTDRLGQAGERLAAKHLRRAGHRVLARNVRRRLGEIDLITLAADRRTIVFVEVKTRAVDPASPAPPPEAAVHAKKRATLVRLAHDVARARGWLDRPLRIDVVAIDWPDSGRPTVRHYEDAVRPAR